MQQAEEKLKQKENEISDLQALLTKKNIELKEQQKDYYKIQNEMNDISHKINENEQYVELAVSEMKRLESQLSQMEEEYIQEIILLEEELDKKQEELAMERAENGEPYEISAETFDVLEQEYEPRFKTLYKNSVFHDKFYKDFYSLVPSDRLKIEAAIANLNYHFDSYIPKEGRILFTQI